MCEFIVLLVFLGSSCNFIVFRPFVLLYQPSFHGGGVCDENNNI